MAQTCKLYRNLYEIFHPSISRKNIAEYKIVLNENILPIQVFYPNKNVELKRVILYIPGEDRNSFFYDELAKQMDCMVFLFDFLEEDNNHKYEKAINYIWDELKKYSIQDGLIFMADGEGCQILNAFSNKEFSMLKKIFLNPLIGFEKKASNSIIITRQEEKKDDDSYSFIGDFSKILKEDGLAIRESIFSIVREFISSDI